MIVADTNLVAYLLIEGERTASARAVWASDNEWMLPTIWRSEFLNVLTTCVRERLMTLAQAYESWHLALTVFGMSEFEASGEQVLEIATARRLTAYDAQFVAAAMELAVPLVTSDRKMLKQCSGLAVTPEQFVAC